MVSPTIDEKSLKQINVNCISGKVQKRVQEQIKARMNREIRLDYQQAIPTSFKRLLPYSAPVPGRRRSIYIYIPRIAQSKYATYQESPKISLAKHTRPTRVTTPSLANETSFKHIGMGVFSWRASGAQIVVSKPPHLEIR
jgi:hypothetical protein